MDKARKILTSIVGQSAEGETELENALQHMTNKLSNVFAVYTCPPIIFTFVPTETTIVIVFFWL